MRILFQGDSITDAHRDRNDPKNLGSGYVFYTAKILSEKYPDKDFEFINFGIGGETGRGISARIDEQGIAQNPDILVLLFGINDAAFKHTDEEYTGNLNEILTKFKEKTKSKIVLLEPFLTEVPSRVGLRERVDPKIKIAREIARKYADEFVPVDGYLAAECVHTDPAVLCADGVHPTEIGSEFIAGYVAKAIEKFL